MPKQKKKTIPKSGDALPRTPDDLSKFPQGCAVMVDGQWWILTFRIGTGASSCNNLRPIPDPHDPGWVKASTKGERRFGGVWKVTDACWPVRRTITRDELTKADSDPLKEKS